MLVMDPQVFSGTTSDASKTLKSLVIDASKADLDLTHAQLKGLSADILAALKGKTITADKIAHPEGSESTHVVLHSESVQIK